MSKLGDTIRGVLEPSEITEATAAGDKTPKAIDPKVAKSEIQDLGPAVEKPDEKDSGPSKVSGKAKKDPAKKIKEKVELDKDDEEIEEGNMDGRTKEYRAHREKLEAARLRRLSSIEDDLDKADPKASKKSFKDREDKDIDNDGEVTDADEYLHNKRKAITKAVAKQDEAKKEKKESTLTKDKEKQDEDTEEDKDHDEIKKEKKESTLTKAKMIEEIGAKMESMKKGNVLKAYEALMTELEDDENIEESLESRFNRDELKIDVSQDVAALLSGEKLSEDFERKAATIFEAAVTDKVEKEIEKLDSKFDEMVTEEVAEIHGSLSTQINDYMSYVTEEWMKENELAIESGIRTELTEDFISGLKDLFQKNYIDIPENKVDVIAELVDKVENLEKKLNEEMERNVELSMDNDVKSKARIVTETCGGLADTEVEKITELAENISFKDAESYRDSIETLRESYFPKTPTWEEEEVEVLDGDTSSSTDVEVSSVMSAINRTVPKR
jgi:hypothetical protein